jgi:hypothetical protein
MREAKKIARHSENTAIIICVAQLIQICTTNTGLTRITKNHKLAPNELDQYLQHSQTWRKFSELAWDTSYDFKTLKQLWDLNSLSTTSSKCYLRQAQPTQLNMAKHIKLLIRQLRYT